MNSNLNMTILPDITSDIFVMMNIDNPAELIENVLEDVNEAFETLYDNYNMSYDDFYKYIRFHNDELSKKIDELWENIDCDIFDHYEQGTLLSFEFSNWQACVIEWKESIIAAILDIVKEEFFEEFRPGQPKPVYVEAA